MRRRWNWMPWPEKPRTSLSDSESTKMTSLAHMSLENVAALRLNGILKPMLGTALVSWDKKSHHYPGVYLAVFYLQSHRLRWQWGSGGGRLLFAVMLGAYRKGEQGSHVLVSTPFSSLVCNLYRNQCISLCSFTFWNNTNIGTIRIYHYSQRTFDLGYFCFFFQNYNAFIQI